MPGTFTQLLVHIVFATNRRKPWIREDIAERLYSYIGGIIRAEKSTLLAIGGVEDHVHIYVRMKPNQSVSAMVRIIKANSSRWIHETFPDLSAFAWQVGYSAFTVSKSQEETLKRYIASQREHHRKIGFKEELIQFLRAHEIEYDVRYVFE